VSRDRKPRLHVYLARLVRVPARFPDPAYSDWKIPAVLWKVGVSYQPEKRMRHFPHYWPYASNFYLTLNRLYVTGLFSNSEARYLERKVLDQIPWNLPDAFPSCCEAITEIRVSKSKRPPVAFMRPIKDRKIELVRLK
jgi:hypothetical protein